MWHTLPFTYATRHADVQREVSAVTPAVETVERNDVVVVDLRDADADHRRLHETADVYLLERRHCARQVHVAQREQTTAVHGCQRKRNTPL